MFLNGKLVIMVIFDILKPACKWIIPYVSGSVWIESCILRISVLPCSHFLCVVNPVFNEESFFTPSRIYRIEKLRYMYVMLLSYGF